MFAPPPSVTAEVFARMPEKYRRTENPEAFSRAHSFSRMTGGFLEGPCFDDQGNLFVVDVPWGRIFRIGPEGNFELAAEYDGEPAGLARHPDGRIFITDFKNGIMVLDPGTGNVTPFLERRGAERFKGVNDLTFSSTGDLYFTDQGVTGFHDPSGKLYRADKDGRLTCVLGNIPSPNGLVLNASDEILFLAVTRANAVWRVPILDDGTTTKVGVFVQLSGGYGPDGMAMDSRGNLAIAHAGMGSVWLVSSKGEPMLRVVSPEGDLTTNAAYGIEDPHNLYITESSTGTILRARMPEPGMRLFGQS